MQQSQIPNQPSQGEDGLTEIARNFRRLQQAHRPISGQEGQMPPPSGPPGVNIDTNENISVSVEANYKIVRQEENISSMSQCSQFYLR